jgi:hypothetical protein
LVILEGSTWLKQFGVDYYISYWFSPWELTKSNMAALELNLVSRSMFHLEEAN